MTAAPLLQVSDLQVVYRTRQGPVTAVDGANLMMRSGQTLALVGGSGSGKSTTAHAVIGLLPAGGVVSRGRVRYDGQDLVNLPERRFRALRGRQIGLVPQDPYLSLNPLQRIGTQVAEVLRIHRLASDRAAAARRVEEVLALAGLPDPATVAKRYPHELSGGMRQRVLIAIALAGEPRLLIADEPTSALDVTVQRRILDHLQTLTAELRMGLLLITHDLAIAADRADEVAVMADGRVVEHGPSRQLLTAPVHPYTARLVSDRPGLARTVARRRPPVVPPGTAPLVEARDLVKEFPAPDGGRLRTVNGVSLTIGPGETLGLVGESGSGKSTLARMLLRLTPPTAGHVLFDGVDITRTDGTALRSLRRRAQMVYQSAAASLDPRWTVRRIIEEPLRAFRIGDRTTRRRRVAELADRTALPGSVLDRRPTELSGGQRQRVAIARALAPDPQLLVCDEPVSALDVTVQTQILSLLEELRRELGLSMLFISHDLAVMRQVADRVSVMYRGDIVETGDNEQLFTAPQHPYTVELLAAIPGHATAGQDAPDPAEARPVV
ncbi:ABC transporter ATP-binding protein [Solwaraspora sp. WMMD1047]|uniref:dipeptide ABC transporter ATP-binding protein n=1 Tax=Solwaraspora sp. WMMD1047 TaxID=3016102 RepID=UPI002417CB10|nr:ABC transporter ATP-binding protein [Solwaraspora sp. WMMD1047]MDG4834250.1 ABC transporter ATP-binding protein [Solwaraspora sp. WMMD1047]